jgi:hypothetical protein
MLGVPSHIVCKQRDRLRLIAGRVCGDGVDIGAARVRRVDLGGPAKFDKRLIMPPHAHQS